MYREELERALLGKLYLTPSEWRAVGRGASRKRERRGQPRQHPLSFASVSPGASAFTLNPGNERGRAQQEEPSHTPRNKEKSVATEAARS